MRSAAGCAWRSRRPTCRVAVRRNGRPITAARPRANSGESVATPRNVSAAPSPTSAPGFEAPPNRAAEIAAMPSASTIPPTITRRRIDELGVELSRSASIGATRDARRDGAHAATTVTPMPTISDTTIVRVSIASAVGGSLQAEGAEQRLEARTPTARRGRCRGSSRSGRPRSIPAAPRSHLTAARPERAEQRQLPGALRHHDVEHVEDDERADEQRDEPEDQEERPQEPEALVDTWSCCWLAAVAAVIASYPFGSTGATPARELVGIDAPVALHVDRVELALAIEQLLRGRQIEQRERRARAGCSTIPKCAMPETVNSPGRLRGDDLDLAGRPRSRGRAAVPASIDHLVRARGRRAAGIDRAGS